MEKHKSRMENSIPTEWNKLEYGHRRKMINFVSFNRKIKTTLFLSYFDL